MDNWKKIKDKFPKAWKLIGGEIYHELIPEWMDAHHIDIIVTRWHYPDQTYYYSYSVFNGRTFEQHYGSKVKSRREALWMGIENAFAFLEQNIERQLEA